jgi:protein-L-isoaspartate(D-aspartate) O-methyltransferase
MDTYRHKGLRKALIDSLRTKGITNEEVLKVMNKVPRHLFLDKAFEEWAYKDQAFPIKAGQTISQPYTVAFQTQLLEPDSSEKVLEIGTGSGYQACILSHLFKKVYTIERQKELFESTNKLFKEIGYEKIRTLFGDGYKGAPRFAPFDKILVTAGATTIPEKLLEQLKIGGYLVVPVGLGDDKDMVRIKKLDEGKYERQSFGIFRFVPFKKGTVD